ncbi:DUF7282 domain-containing protein [Salinimicrobium flavum]|uniref:DUF7282 domain-containing protein n=1 Tax=Salinimicrobium flavum TaxID=1737065 RepID=A0ABW5IVI3_9FLAO
MKKILLLWGLLIGTVFIGCSDDDDSRDTQDDVLSGSLSVRNQVYGKGAMMVDGVGITQNGWIAIYRYGLEKGDLVGLTFIEAGIHRDVVIELDANVENGETLLAVLHHDTNANKLFEWEGDQGIDLPLTIGSREMSKKFTFYIRPDYADYWITIDDQSLSAGPFWDLLKVKNIDVESIEKLLKGNAVWLVAYTWDVEGLNERIGFSDRLEIKSHDQASVYIEGFVPKGDTIWLVLFDDTGEEGVFEDTDEMIWDPENGGFLMTPVTIL